MIYLKNLMKYRKTISYLWILIILKIIIIINNHHHKINKILLYQMIKINILCANFVIIKYK